MSVIALVVESSRSGDIAVVFLVWDWDCEVLSGIDAAVDESVNKELDRDGDVDWDGDFDVD